MKFIFCLWVFLFFSVINLTGQNLSWISHYQGNSIVNVRGVEFDSAGFVYVCGTFRDTFFYESNDPHKWTVSERRNSFAMSHDNFIQKLDSNGIVIWTKWFGNRQDDNIQGIKVSRSGHIYAYGIFQETVDFDLDTTIYEMTSAGSGDAFMAKYDLDGGIIWAKSFKGPSTIGTYGLDVDEDDNVYVTGFHIGLADFNTDSSGIDTFTSKSFHDIFVAKLNDTGKLVWVHSYGSAQGQFVRHAGNSISYDGMGAVWVCGKFRDSLIINKPGQRVLVHTRADDGLVFKYNTAGVLLHAKVVHTSTGDGSASQIINDANGNAYICGSGRGDIDFDTIRVGTRYGNLDPFLIKVDSSCNYLWGLNMSNTRNSRAYGVALNSEGVNMVGVFRDDSIQVDPIGVGRFVQPITSNNNVFVLTYNPSNGELRNALVYGAAGESIAQDIQTKGDKIIIGGEFSASGDFNPGKGVDSLFSKGNSRDGFLQYFNNCPTSFLTFDTTVCDSFFWTVDSTWYFTSTNKSIKEVNSKGCDSMISLRLIVGLNTFRSDTIVACDSFTWINGVTYFANNDSAKHVIPNHSGCDSIVSLYLTINKTSFFTDSVHACDSFSWIDGVTYFASNNSATHIIPNQSGCDSVITLHLTLGYTSFFLDSIVACDSFAWIDGVTYFASNDSATHIIPNQSGCDSVITLHLTLNQASSFTDTVVACGTYTWLDGITYTSSNNTATHIIPNQSGCDSVITLHLKVIGIDTSVFMENQLLISIDSLAKHQWLNCETGFFKIVGENSFRFEPQAKGRFAVEITKEHCIDTSSCIIFEPLSVFGKQLGEHLIGIFPNPSDGSVFVSLKGIHKGVLKVYDLYGKLSASYGINQAIEIELPSATGIYLLCIETTDGIFCRRVVRL